MSEQTQPETISMPLSPPSPREVSMGTERERLEAEELDRLEALACDSLAPRRLAIRAGMLGALVAEVRALREFRDAYEAYRAASDAEYALTLTACTGTERRAAEARSADALDCFLSARAALRATGAAQEVGRAD